MVSFLFAENIVAQYLTLPAHPTNYNEKISYLRSDISYATQDSGVYVTSFEDYRLHYFKEIHQVTKYLLDDSTIITYLHHQDSTFHNNSFGNPAYTYIDRIGSFTYDQDSLLIDSVIYIDIDSSYKPIKVASLFQDLSFPDSIALENLVNNGWNYAWLSPKVLKLDSASFTYLLDSLRARVVIEYGDIDDTKEFSSYQWISSCGYYLKGELTVKQVDFLYGRGVAKSIIKHTNLIGECNSPENITRVKSANKLKGIERDFVTLKTNPVSNYLQLNLITRSITSNSPTIEWDITNAMGSKINSGKAHLTGETLQIGLVEMNLIPGYYILQVKHAGKVQTIPFIKS